MRVLFVDSDLALALIVHLLQYNDGLGEVLIYLTILLSFKFYFDIS